MRTQPKESPINIRAKAAQRDLIDRAAELVSKSRTDFVLEAACREAEDILLDQRLFMADENQYNAFLKALEAPVSENVGLADLLSRRAPWE
ncbi:type II toxin-antitoxin system TacA family antitoxin [Dryocola clanedunensis]